ncbi:MAG: outer membrane protein assembly factor BamD [Pirellulales bacterium]
MKTLLLGCFALILSIGFAPFECLGQQPVDGVSPEQAAWWEQNRQRAVYIEGRGFHVPGTPGFFNEAGRPLTDAARMEVRRELSRFATTGPSNDDDGGIPIDFSFLNNRASANRGAGVDPTTQTAPIAPADVQLTPEQAQWWEANRQRAVFVPGRGFQISGEPGFFDPYGRKLPEQAPLAPPPAANVSAPPVDNNGPPPQRRRTADDSDEGIGIGAGGLEDYVDRFRGNGEGRPSDYEGMKLFPWQKDPPPNEGIARDFFREAEAAFREKDYAVAAVKYKAAGRALPKSSIEEDAIFMQAESQFFADEYPGAFTTYETLLEKYKRTRHLDKVTTRLFAIGQYWVKLHMENPKWLTTPNLTDSSRPRYDTLGHGLRAFDRIRLTDPTGPLADDSLLATGNAYFVREYYDDAGYYYGLLIDEYPQSDLLKTAYQLGIQSKMRSYQGPTYEPKPLDDAKEWIDQALAHFPDQAPEERQRLLQHRRELDVAYAARDIARGQYYENLDHARAARYYYAQVLKKYPHTPMSQQAEQRIASLQNLPDAPEEKFEWLSYVFPDKPAGPTIVADKPDRTTDDDTLRR